MPSSMTYTSWREENSRKVSSIQLRLESEGLTPSQVVDYFSYDNMVEKEPNHCALYATHTKCHDMEDLNCFLCACPHFVCNDNFPYKEENNLKYFSKCGIKSKFAGEFIYDGNVHCNCAGCTIPHKKNVALKHYRASEPYEITEGPSLIELIRGWQLSDILGKFKLF